MIRFLSFALLTASLTGVAAAQADDGDSVLHALRSEKAEQAVSAIRGLKRSQLADRRILRTTLELTMSRVEQVRDAARKRLAGEGAALAPVLVAFAKDDASRAAVVAVRLAGRIGGAKAAPALFELLDHESEKVAQAVVAVLARHGRELADELLERYDDLKRTLEEAAKLEEDAGDSDERRRFIEGHRHAYENRMADVLTLLAAHGVKDTDFRVCDQMKRGSPRMRSIAERLLARHYPATFLPMARERLVAREGPDRERLYDFVERQGVPADRGLALRIWSKTKKRDPALTRLLGRLFATTRDWLGIIVPDPAIASVSFGLQMTNHRTGRHRRLDLDSRHHGVHPELFRGTTVELPLAHLLHHTELCSIATTTAEDGSPELHVTLARPRPFRFGVGTRLLREWEVRFGFDIARFVTRLDRKRGVPLSSRYFDAKGRHVGTATFGGWIETSPGRFAPAHIEITDGSIVMRASYTWSEGCWHLVKVGVRRGKPWAEGHVADLKVTRRT